MQFSQNANVDFVFTNEKLNKKDYGFEIEYEKAKELKCTFLSNGVVGFIEIIKILRDIENYDFVELPPLDSIREVIYGSYIVIKAKIKKVKTGYFGEKWDAPRKVQPLERRIKNQILRIIPRMIYRQVNVIFFNREKEQRIFCLKWRK